VRKPRIPFYSNVTGSQLEDPEAIRQALIDQIENSVRWKQIVQALLDRGLEGALELGPGKVLQGLMRSFRRDMEVISVGTCADLDRVTDLCPQVEAH